MDKKSYNQQYYLKNKEKIIAQSKQWAKENTNRRKEIARNSHTKRKYGITLEQETALKIKQDNKCSICNDLLGDGYKTHIDHCHTTGQIRGILCQSCNLLLGAAKDSTKLLKSAQKYLNKYTKPLAKTSV